MHDLAVRGGGLLDVHACGEGPARRGAKHHDVDVVIFGDAAPHGFTLGHHGLGETVELFGPIEGDRGYLVGDVDDQGLVGHVISLFLVVLFRAR